MAATVGSLRIELSASIAQFQADLGKAASAMKDFGRQATVMANDFKKTGAQLQGIGLALSKTLTLPLVAVGGAAAKVGIDFESAFAGVRKTVDGAVDSMGNLTKFGAELEQGFRDLAKVIPISVNELAKLGETAGELGIPKDDVLQFAEVMAKLGVTTNLTADAAAGAVAKIQNIFGAAGQDTERFASTLVALGNNGASTETQIVEMATRIAGAGHTVGLTQGQVLAFGSALSSVGIEAEAGGTAISRVFIELAKSVAKGGTELDGFARVAGMSAAKFAVAFKTDAAGATTSFIEGLGGIQKAGGDLFQTLSDLGLNEIRVRDALLRAAGAGDLLRNALDLQAKAWRENSALTKEAEQRFKTTASQLTLLGNRIADVGITLFTSMKPAIDSAIKGVNAFLPALEKMAQVFGSLPGNVQLGVLGLGAFAAGLGPAIFIGGQLVSSLGTLIGAFGKTGIATRGIIAALGFAEKTIGTLRLASVGLSATFGSIVWPVAAVTALGFALNETATGVKNLVNAWKEGHLWETLTSKDDDTWARRWLGLSSGMNEATLSARQLGAGFVTVMPALSGLGDAIAGAGQKFSGSVAPTEAAQAALSKYREAVADLVRTLSGADAVGELKKLRDAFASLPAGASQDIQVLIRVAAAFSKLGDELDASKLPKDLQVFVERMRDVAADVAAAERAERIFNGTMAAGVKPIQDMGISLDALRNISRGFTSEGYLQSYIDQTEIAQTASANFATELKRTRDALKAQLSGVYTLPKVEPNVDFPALRAEGVKSGNTFVAALQSTLARIPDTFKSAFTGGGGVLGALKSILVDLGSTIGSILAAKIAGAISGGIGKGTSGASIGGTLGGTAVSLGATAAVGGLGIGAATAGTATAATLSGTIATAAVTAGVTAGISLAVIGGIALYKKLATPEWKKLGKDIGRDFGVTLSDETLKSLAGDSQKFGRQATEIFNLDKIIGGSGGLNDSNITKFTASLHDVFSLLQTGSFNSAQAAQVLDTNFQGFADHWLAKGPLIGKDLVEIVRLTHNLGVEAKAVGDFIKGQIDTNIVPGLAAFTGASKKASDALVESQAKLKDLQGQLAGASGAEQQADLRKQIAGVTEEIRKEQGVISATMITSEGAANALGATVAVAFSEMMKAGTPILDIVNKLDPVVASLGTQFAAAGFSGGAAFEKIRGLVALASDEIAGPAVQAATGLGQALAGLSNIGQLDQGTFTGLTDQIDATFNSLVAQGASSSQVLALMQSPLQTIFELQSQFGYAVDAGTQALLDQAVAAGVVGEAQKPVQQQLLDATNTIATAVTGLARAFGVDLPAAVTTGAGAVTAGAQGMSTALGTTVAAAAQTAGGAIADIPAAMAAASAQATSDAAALAAAMSTALPDGASTAANSIDGISGAMDAATAASISALQALAGAMSTSLPEAAGGATDSIKGQLDQIQQLFTQDTPDAIKAGADAAAQLLASLGTDTGGDLDGVAENVRNYLATALQDVQDHLGDLPGDTKSVADKISDALAKIIVPSIRIPISIDDQTGAGTLPDVSGASTGGRVTPSGIQRFALGGMVQAVRSFASGTDTVPAMLTPGELVLNRAQQSAVFSAMAGGLSGRESLVSQADLADSDRSARAAAPAAGEQHFHFSIQAIDQTGLRHLVTKPGGVAEMVMVAAAQGKHGLDEKFRRALRVP